MNADQPRGRPGHRPGDSADWPLPIAAGPIRAVVRPPGSKSMTNRALVLAALADGPTVITGPLAARDTTLMVSALRALGCQILTGDQPSGSWQVRPASPDAADREATVDVGNAGTVLRFVPALAALTRAAVTFRGDEQASRRPVGPLLAALRQLGADIDDHGTGAAPFLVRGRGGLRGGPASVDASASSQLISGLLLAAPRFEQGVRVRHEGPPVPSAPHIEMTVRMLRARGAAVRAGADDRPARAAGTAGGQAVADSWQVLPGPISGGQVDIEPDLSNTVPFLAAALVTGGEVTVPGWPADSLQPAGAILSLLTAMGATVTATSAGLRVSGAGRVRGIRANLSEVGELTPVLTALAAVASSPSEFTGVAHVRRHETDRLAALAGEIGRLGATVTELPDGLAIRPGRLRANGAMFDSHDDHRLVMAAAVLGLVTPGLQVRNAVTVGKTFPGFRTIWSQMLAPGPCCEPSDA